MQITLSALSVFSLELAALEVFSCLKEESDLVLNWLMKQGLFFFLQSFDEGLEVIFASAMVSSNKF